MLCFWKIRDSGKIVFKKKNQKMFILNLLIIFPKIVLFVFYIVSYIIIFINVGKLFGVKA